MGYLSCNAESAIATCNSHNWELLTKNPRKKNNSTTRPFNVTEFTYTDLHSSTNNFSQKNLLGKGSHGSVYKAHLHHIKLIAAVKIIKQTHATTIAAVDNEVEILSRIYHPRLVNLLGYAVNPNDQQQHKLIVVEYMPNGSLFDLLHGSGKPPGWVKRTRFALQIAKAVRFLHESDPPIIHRDIKSSNVLIDSRFDSRLSDLGLALRGHVEDVRVKCTPPAGTLGYLDPGYLAPGDLTPKSDVFSFGILMLEIITGRNAIDVNYSPPSIVDWAIPAIKSGDFAGILDPRIGRPRNENTIRRMAILAARCVRSTAERRPSMAEVVECLKRVCGRTTKVISPQICVDLRRRVERVGEYEALDESVEMVRNSSSSRAGSRRNGKVTSVAGAEDLRSDRVVRSKSIGTTREMNLWPLDRKRVGLDVKMPTVRLLSKSRSMGILQSSSSIGRKNHVEESKLLVALGDNIVREIEKDT